MSGVIYAALLNNEVVTVTLDQPDGKTVELYGNETYVIGSITAPQSYQAVVNIGPKGDPGISGIQGIESIAASLILS